MIDNKFGKPLPFSKTPKGTVAVPWAQLDGKTTFEVDLPPNSDDASIRLIGVYHLDFMGQSQLERAGTLKVEGNANIITYLIGDIEETVINPISNGGLALNLAAKFWITSDNILQEVSEIYHVEIPDTYDNILWSKYEKDSYEYKEISKKFSI